MISLASPYERRNVHSLGLVELLGWKIKVYEIYRNNEAASVIGAEHPAVTHAKNFAMTILEQPPEDRARYGVGFLIVHRGIDRNWVLLDWWYEREILKQVLMSSPLDRPEEIVVETGDLMACTWELAVIGFERDAWVQTVLCNPKGPDLAAYCKQEMNAVV